MENACTPRTLKSSNLRAGLLRSAVAIALLFSVGESISFAASGVGKIAVQSVPAGATVYLDGQPNGKSPATIEGLPPGHYLLRLELTGYHPAEFVVDLGSGQTFQSPSIELVSESAPLPKPAMPAAAPKMAAPTPAPKAAPAPTPVVPPRPLENGGFPAVKESTIPMPAPKTEEAPTPPAATPPAPVPPPTPAPNDGAAGDDTPVRARVNDYLNAIADGNVDAYVQICAPTVEFYEDGTKSQAAIRKIRQQFKERWPVYKIENVRELSVHPSDHPDVVRASVTYDWKVSNPKSGKKASGTATDQLDFRESSGKWLLIRARQTVERSRH